MSMTVYWWLLAANLALLVGSGICLLIAFRDLDKYRAGSIGIALWVLWIPTFFVTVAAIPYVRQ